MIHRPVYTAGALHGAFQGEPSLLPTKALSAEKSQIQSAAVIFSQQWDAAWLSEVHRNDRPVEWAGFNAQQDRLMAGSAQKPKTLVVFGPMIDSPPAHPDTVITTFVNLRRALNSFGVQCTHITVDLQLYQIAYLVQWNDPLRYTNVILHPGMTHTLVSFLGYIGTLRNFSLASSCKRSSSLASPTPAWHHHASAPPLWPHQIQPDIFLQAFLLSGLTNSSLTSSCKSSSSLASSIPAWHPPACALPFWPH